MMPREEICLSDGYAPSRLLSALSCAQRCLFDIYCFILRHFSYLLICLFSCFRYCLLHRVLLLSPRHVIAPQSAFFSFLLLILPRSKIRIFTNLQLAFIISTFA